VIHEIGVALMQIDGAVVDGRVRGCGVHGTEEAPGRVSTSSTGRAPAPRMSASRSPVPLRQNQPAARRRSRPRASKSGSRTAETGPNGERWPRSAAAHRQQRRMRRKDAGCPGRAQSFSWCTEQSLRMMDQESVWWIVLATSTASASPPPRPPSRPAATSTIECRDSRPGGRRRGRTRRRRARVRWWRPLRPALRDAGHPPVPAAPQRGNPRGRRRPDRRASD
jgi:hypothetical protein